MLNLNLNLILNLTKKLHVMKNYTSLEDATNDLKRRGYDFDFSTTSDCLYCGDLDMRLDPEDFHVDEIYRFDQKSETVRSSVIYAISSSTGPKGIIVDTDGTHVETLHIDIVKKLQDAHSLLS